jgi:single-strand DNA-binding protein
MNLVVFKGRLTRDPELKYTQAGKAIAGFGLAVENFKDTLFLDCEAWEKTAEHINEYFKKGKEILISGRLRADTWEKEGVKNTRLIVVVERSEFCGNKDDSAPKQEKPKKSAKAAKVVQDDSALEDLPF